MNHEILTRVARAIALAHKVGSRERYFSNVEVTTEGVHLSVKCVITVDQNVLLTHNEIACVSTLDKLIDMLEYTKKESIDDAIEVATNHRRGY